MVDRIKHVMEYYEETPNSFAEKVGVNRSNLTHLFSGRNQPSLDFAKKVLTAFPEVSTEWLIMGVGNMIKDPEEEVSVKQQAFVQTDLFGAMENNVEEETEPEVETGMDSASFEEQQNEPENDAHENSVPIEQQIVDSKPVEQEEAPVVTPLESKIQNKPVRRAEKINSRQVERRTVASASRSIPMPSEKSQTTSAVREKKIEKIIFFYDDDSFKVYHP